MKEVADTIDRMSNHQVPPTSLRAHPELVHTPAIVCGRNQNEATLQGNGRKVTSQLHLQSPHSARIRCPRADRTRKLTLAGA